MSYLLDALKKADDQDGSPSTLTASSPVITEHNAQPSIFVWISAVLAVLLALTVGYLLGNKFNLVEPVEPKVVAVTPIPVPATSEPLSLESTLDLPSTPANTPVENSLSSVASIVSDNQRVASVAEVENPITDDANVAEVATNDNKDVAQTKTLVVKANDDEKTTSVIEAVEDEVILGYVPDQNENALNNLTDSLSDADISPELIAQFKQAVSANASSDAAEVDVLDRSGLGEGVVSIYELPEHVQQQIPVLRFNTHIYATESAQRWIKVNNKVIQEKQWITAGVRLMRIHPQHVVMSIDDYQFSLPALTDWDGL